MAEGYKEKFFIDIGSWIGAISLFAARKYEYCFSIEPDIEAYEELTTNINHNPDLLNYIKPYNISIWDHDGTVRKVNEKGDSMTYTEDGDDGRCLTIPSFFNNEILKLFPDAVPSDVGFIKCDTEGAEYKIFSDGRTKEYIKQYKPILHLSIHCFNRIKTGFDIFNYLFKTYEFVYNYPSQKVNFEYLEARKKNIDTELLFTNVEW